MHFSNSVKIAATPAVIYELYARVSEWPAWDSEVERAEVSGPFAAGTLGMLKPRGGPQSRIELVEVTPGKSFTVRSKLPLCEMVFGHELIQAGSLTTATHSVSFAGPLSAIFGFLIGRGIRKTLPVTLEGLKKAAEARQGLVDKA
jgi:hypothetical protein